MPTATDLRNALDSDAAGIPTPLLPSNPIFLVSAARDDPEFCFERSFRAKPARLSSAQGSGHSHGRAKNNHPKIRRLSSFST